MIQSGPHTSSGRAGPARPPVASLPQSHVSGPSVYGVRVDIITRPGELSGTQDRGHHGTVRQGQRQLLGFRRICILPE
ncbi:hypothetical protein J6590_047107 [Homalodisca vitripennis]|nr:hypothetical protein J6590_047107 [Homalodisca vitripennis]